MADEPPALATDPGMIRGGYHAELDELRNLSQHSKQIIASMEERERKRTAIGSLKIRFNNIFGYYIEISKANLHLAPADYERKQTLVNAERFTSPELKEYERKILAADERILEIERQLLCGFAGGDCGEGGTAAKDGGGDCATGCADLFCETGGGPELCAAGI